MQSAPISLRRSACAVLVLTCKKAATVWRKEESNSWHFGIDC
ncbi:hypothetical protein SLEP1_g57880 [Rubroshorea leprosula]|uniref:Uncharacterized protein n=1 Tax=Rubroshorea leprosula TaxID=152421 RepID=A0AAV5MMR0_9ROSI|nr:hypothetical protein SLEP1_g57880 [Rubroshorea leprosula]